MPYTFSLMSESDARAVNAWRYEEPYAIYNPTDPEDVAELLDRRSPYFAVRDDAGELVGFFAFGTAAKVEGEDEPALYGLDRTLTVGLGLRPDCTDRGLGLAFVNAGLAFARAQFAPSAFRLFVLTFNARAIRVYERAGFQPVRVFTLPSPHGTREFLEMVRAH
jgi:RimJ/RimL family protein N-acetyltransferase